MGGGAELYSRVPCFTAGEGGKNKIVMMATTKINQNGRQEKEKYRRHFLQTSEPGTIKKDLTIYFQSKAEYINKSRLLRGLVL
jgi:hypothetical protein